MILDKKWVLNTSTNTELVAELTKELRVSKTLVSILVQRGITNFEEAKRFFRPQLSDLYSPFLMKDMDIAIQRIERALQHNENIMIYGDYDVDGTTAVSLCYQFFANYTSNISYYIPDRNNEGYGISIAGIDHAETINVSLIIALDCGIRSLDKIDYANSKNIDFVICDHHLPGDILPNAVAVLDPKRKDCHYPFKELSGCGIGFKLIQAYCIKNNIDDNEYLKYLDLCMVSVAADIVPIVDENRVLAYYGLKKLNNQPSLGLLSLMKTTGKNNNYDITDVVFLLAPRINAVGRMKHAHSAVKALISVEEVEADKLCEFINEQNISRKDFDKTITEQALAMIEEDERLLNAKSTVVFQNNWNKGVIGIVASRLTESYYRPTIVMTESNGAYTGSARSVAGYDLYAALQECSDLLVQFGGHKFAAGLTLLPENLKAFREKFEQVVSSTIEAEQLKPSIKIDVEISLSQITDNFVKILKQMSPFGPENMTPVFLTRGVTFVSYPQVLGKNHLKMIIKQENSSTFEAIGFGLGEFDKILNPNQYFDICYTIEENEWKDKKQIQLNLKGIKVN